MHYKNGRPVTNGDIVVGVSHNSKGEIVIGVVIEQMPQQGTCNIKLALIEIVSREHAQKRETSYVDLHNTDNTVLVGYGLHDYGDAAQFLKCEDGLRLAKAAECATKYGHWNSVYYP